jgi:hypothetical protein
VLTAHDDFATEASMEGLPAALAAARDGIDALLRDRGLRRTTPDVTSASLLAGAVASAALEGSRSSLDEVRSGDADEVATGAVRMSAELLAQLPVLARSPLQALARMHALAARGTVEDRFLGRPRAEAGLASRLQLLARRLLQPTDAPAIAVAALAHAELVAMAPFVTANGLVARATERLVLVSRRVDPASVTVPEAGHLAMSEEYDAALRAYRDGGAGGRRRWLLHAAAAITYGASRSPLLQPPATSTGSQRDVRA